MKKLISFLNDILDVLLLLVGIALCLCVLTLIAYKALHLLA